jgi:hypothetical protein
MSARADVFPPIGTVVSGEPLAMWSKRQLGAYFVNGLVPPRITGKVYSGSSDLKLEVEWDVCGRKRRFLHLPGALQIVNCSRNRAATGAGGAAEEEEGMEEDSSEDEEDLDSDPGDEDEEVVEPDDSAVDGVVKMKDGVEWRFMPDGVEVCERRRGGAENFKAKLNWGTGRYEVEPEKTPLAYFKLMMLDSAGMAVILLMINTAMTAPKNYPKATLKDISLPNRGDCAAYQSDFEDKGTLTASVWNEPGRGKKARKLVLSTCCTTERVANVQRWLHVAG